MAFLRTTPHLTTFAVIDAGIEVAGEVTGEVSREERERRKRKLAIDVDAVELHPCKIEVKEEPPGTA